MGKKLVAYFSTGGITKVIAERLAEAVRAEVYEIRPQTPYTHNDLNWLDRTSRSSVEMADKSCRPPLADSSADVAGADVVYVGFPVWWYREPSIVDTFLEAYDFSGKTIVPFCTSGSSDIGDTAVRMREIVGDDAKVLPGRRFSANATIAQLKDWADKINQKKKPR